MRFRINSLASLALSGLLLLGGCGGGGSSGGGGSGLPTASNPAIDPPPATLIGISTGPGAATTNGTIAAAVFESVDLLEFDPADLADTIGVLPSPPQQFVSIKTSSAATQSARDSIANIVRSQAEKIWAHQGQASVTGAQIIQTTGCGFGGTSGGTETVVFDDVSLSSSVILVNCVEEGGFSHGTISATNIVVTSDLPLVVGQKYLITISGSTAIDLSFTATDQAFSEAIQGSFDFTATLAGLMIPDGAGVIPGPPLAFSAEISGNSLLVKGVETEQLSNFSIIIEDQNDPEFSFTSVFGSFTYASTEIGGAVTVVIPGANPIVTFSNVAFANVLANSNPSQGTIEITANPGKILLEIVGPDDLQGVRVSVFSSVDQMIPLQELFATWPDFLARIFIEIV